VAFDTDGHLLRTSRTFALAIPLLEEPLRTSVALAYLLLRVADTLEDATRWSRAQRIDALHTFARHLERGDDVASTCASWADTPPTDHAHDLALLADLPALVQATHALPHTQHAIVMHHVVRVTRGMARVLETSDESGHVQLTSESALVDYCYVVAGMVGELLTDLVAHVHALPDDVTRTLHALDAAFGEGLQLVNILKDEGDDARVGRRFLPAQLSRDDVKVRAVRDLRHAQHYVQTLEQARVPADVVAFIALPACLAVETLALWDAQGAQARMGRARVGVVLADVVEHARMQQAATVLARALLPLAHCE
jgi:farnesyl-diphosphate farnesyltransferase